MEQKHHDYHLVPFPLLFHKYPLDPAEKFHISSPEPGHGRLPDLPPEVKIKHQVEHGDFNGI